MAEGTIGEVFAQLARAGAAYKFASVDGETVIAVDGFARSLKRSC